MLRLIFFITVLFLSVWFGLEVVRHPGYVLLMYKPWMVQMPLWFALFGFVLFFGFFYLVINSLDRMEFMWFYFKNWLRTRRERKSYSKTQHGLGMLIEGRWKKAERLLISGVDKTVEPLMNYLGAAKAAHELGAFDRRDSYIQKAYRSAPDAGLAIGLTQAELDLAQDRLEHASATLNRLIEMSPRHPRVLKMLEKVYVRTADWKGLEKILPAMRKAKILTADEMTAFEKNIYREILQVAHRNTLDEVQVIWNGFPRYIKKKADVVCAYVKQLQRFAGTEKEIEDLIRKTLKNDWNAELANIYGHLKFDNLNRQLVIAGAWLKQYGPQPELYLLLGKLCAQIKLWGKAKDYLDKCLALGPNAEASLVYGQLLEALDQHEEAIQKYRDGLIQLAQANM